MNIVQRIEWRLYKELKRIRLKNRNATIISSNCNGEFIYHDLKLRFLSPTINLSFNMNDYVKFLENLRWYLQQDITPFEDPRFSFPCGMLADIEIRFNHYSTFSEAVDKWNERKQRINWDNLYILAIDGDDCTEESIHRFANLPYKHKVIFTHVPRHDISCSYYIKGFEDKPGIGVVIDFKKQFFVRRYLDDFDYVTFLNSQDL